MKSIYINSCGNCKYRKRAVGKEPCFTCNGMRHLHHKHLWRPSLATKIRRFWDKFTDDNELIGFKVTVVMILMIIGMMLDV